MTIYMDLNGRTACAQHGGSYLAGALQQNPKARVINTPITSWERIPRREVQAYVLVCETCGGGR